MTHAYAASHQWKASAISVLVHASVALAIGLMASHAPRTAMMKTMDLGLLEQIASAPAPEPMPRHTPKAPPPAPKPVVKQAPATEPMPAEVVEETLPVEPVDTQSLPEVPAAPNNQDEPGDAPLTSDALAEGPVAPMTSGPHHDPGPSDWDLRMISERIRAGLKYPAIARRMGWAGTVRVAFVICCDGTVRNVELVESSGSPVLDKNALKVIEEFPRFPARAREARVVVPIVYDLRDAG